MLVVVDIVKVLVKVGFPVTVLNPTEIPVGGGTGSAVDSVTGCMLPLSRVTVTVAV
jgi:hypothetical protein